MVFDPPDSFWELSARKADGEALIKHGADEGRFYGCERAEFRRAVGRRRFHARGGFSRRDRRDVHAERREALEGDVVQRRHEIRFDPGLFESSRPGQRKISVAARRHRENNAPRGARDHGRPARDVPQRVVRRRVAVRQRRAAELLAAFDGPGGAGQAVGTSP